MQTSILSRTQRPTRHRYDSFLLRLYCELRASWILLLPLLLVGPAQSQAQLSYTTNNGTITITGYNGGGDVTIPETINSLPVTSIGDQAFSFGSLSTVTIPNSVTHIGGGAFAYCPYLTAITVGPSNSAYIDVDGVLFDYSQTVLIQYPGFRSVASYAIPASVTSIGDWAFAEGFRLTNIVIPNTVTNIGTQAFDACSSLTGINVDPLNPSYSSGDGILFNKDQTTLIQYPAGGSGSYTTPDSVTNVGDGAFEHSRGLGSITLGKSVTSLGQSAFLGCTSLTNITLPIGVTDIGRFTFEACTSLIIIEIPSSVATLGDAAFAGCSSLVSVTIPSNVTSIGIAEFQECFSLTNIAIPVGVTNIGRLAFQRCALKSVTVPNSVTSIASKAFMQCTNLVSVNIGSGVTNIEIDAFLSCNSLTSMNIDPQNLNYSSVAGVLFDKSQTTLLQFPWGLAGSYSIPNSATKIGELAFASRISLASVTIPSSVNNIGSGAFSGCYALTNVTIGNGVTNIDDTAMSGCPALVGIYFEGNAPNNLYSNVFSGDDNATIYYLPGATGWGANLGGLPTAVWKPQILADAVGSGQFGFNVTWAGGKTVVIEAITNLAELGWVPVGTNTLTTTGSLHFNDPEWQNYAGRVYRVRSQ